MGNFLTLLLAVIFFFEDLWLIAVVVVVADGSRSPTIVSVLVNVMCPPCPPPLPHSPSHPPPCRAFTEQVLESQVAGFDAMVAEMQDDLASLAEELHECRADRKRLRDANEELKKLVQVLQYKLSQMEKKHGKYRVPRTLAYSRPPTEVDDLHTLRLLQLNKSPPKTSKRPRKAAPPLPSERQAATTRRAMDQKMEVRGCVRGCSVLCSHVLATRCCCAVLTSVFVDLMRCGHRIGLPGACVCSTLKAKDRVPPGRQRQVTAVAARRHRPIEPTAAGTPTMKGARRREVAAVGGGAAAGEHRGVGGGAGRGRRQSLAKRSDDAS